MGKISWTDQTWNPIVGCTKVSEGCENCWAERMARLHYHEKFPEGWNGVAQLFQERLCQPLHWRKPRKIAVGLMGDLFHESVPFWFLDQIWATMGCCEAPDLRHLTFQVLTKRPGRTLEYARYRESSGMVFNLPNLWLGISCENQAAADERIPLLLQTPAAVRFVSCEPLLGPIHLRLSDCRCRGNDEFVHKHYTDPPHECARCLECKGFVGLDWVIVGGESGPGARPMHQDWVRSLRGQCQVAEVPFHFKQWGEWAACGLMRPDPDFLGGECFDSARGGTCAGAKLVTAGCSYFHRFKDGQIMERVGKKAAGRLLDGKEWLEFPKIK